MGDLPGDVRVSIATPVGIVLAERSGRLRRIETLALQVAEIQAEVGVAEGAVDAAAHAGRVVRSNSGRDAGCRRVLAALGEDLDHAPDRVGAVQAAQLPGHDLDPLDLAERNVLERRRAERGRADPHAVDQHERMTAIGPAHKHAARLPESAVARSLDPAQCLQHFDQSLLTASGDVFAGDDADRLQRLSAGLRESGGGDDYRVFRTLSKRKRRRGRGERGNDGSSQDFLPGMRPRRPNSRCERKCTWNAPALHRAPRHFPPSVEAGLRACGIGAYRLPVSSRSQWQSLESDAKAHDLRLLVDTPAPLTVAGAAEDLERTRDPGIREGKPLLNPRSEPASAPLSRFTPARGTRRDTSNERVDCTTQVAGLQLAAASGIYIENESLHLDLTGFSKL